VLDPERQDPVRPAGGPGTLFELGPQPDVLLLYIMQPVVLLSLLLLEVSVLRREGGLLLRALVQLALEAVEAPLERA
jgi:hypothetical protein